MELDVTAPQGCGSLVGTDCVSWLAKEWMEAGAASDVLQTKEPGSTVLLRSSHPPTSPCWILDMGGCPSGADLPEGRKKSCWQPTPPLRFST